MQQRHLGPHPVGAIGFGAMSLGGHFGPVSEATSFGVLDRARTEGMNHLDVANIYGNGRSEEVLGAWMAARGTGPGRGVVLATKAAIRPGPPREICNEGAYLTAELEGSLKRMGVDHVDLFYIHRRDTRISHEDLAQTLSRLIERGLIGGYGLSEVAPSTLTAMHALLPCMAVQSEYSLLTRQPELGMVQACARLGVSFVAFSPFARGLLVESPMAPPTDGFRASNPRYTGENFQHNLQLAEALRQFATARGWSATGVALAWLLERGPHVLPIPATRLESHLEPWLTANDIRFSDEDRAELDRILPPGCAHGDRYSDDQRTGAQLYC